MRRRDVLKHIGAAAALAPISRSSSFAATAGPKLLSAELSLAGRQLVFHESAGEDAGDFSDDGVVQRCIRATIADVPLTVFFRRDRGDDRVEVVFELGRAWGAANAVARHLGAYTATIKAGVDTLAVVNVPQHWWFARWRWQSKPRAVRKTAADLVTARLLPPYGKDAAVFASASNAARAEYAVPMDNAGILMAMGATGERNEIGPITEYQGDYLITGREAALRAMLAQGEAASSMPIHIRDEKTWAPVDVFEHPGVDWYETKTGKPWINTLHSKPDAGGLACPWHLDSSHDPALAYVPYVLTGDPYFLEELQFQGTQALGWTSYQRVQSKRQIVSPDQTRGYAWSLRTIFQLAKVTPDVVPKWLKPRSYWKKVLDDNLAWFTKTYVNDTSAASTVFHAATCLDKVGAWQEEFLAFVLGWGVWMGFEEWRPSFVWKVQSTLARTNGKSGWPRQFCTPYYFSIGWQPGASAIYPSESPTGTWYKDWAEAWDKFRSDPRNHVRWPFEDNVSWAQSKDPSYLGYTRGVLALATHLGVAEAQECFVFVNEMSERAKFGMYKWAIEAA